MRTALLTDIHANLQALTAVLEDIRDCDVKAIACLGDTVGYGADPRRCVELIHALGCPCVLGNHDSYAITDSPQMTQLLSSEAIWEQPVWSGIKLAREQLLDDQLEWLQGLDSIYNIAGALISHAALHGSGTWPYLRTSGDAQPTLRLLEGTVGFFGHTHCENVFVPAGGDDPEEMDPRLFRLPAGSVAITVGSVGQPRDGDARARWVIWDSVARTVEFRRVPYDYKSASQAILDAGLPALNAMRLLPRD